MRISYLFNSSTPSSNPGSIQVINTCNGFASLGHEIKVIVPNTGKNISLKKFYGVNNNIKLIKIKLFDKFPLGLNYYLFSIVSVLYAVFYNTDLFITRNFFTLFVLNILKKKVIIEIHHDLKNEGRIIQWIFKNIDVLNKKNLLKIIAITNPVKSFLVRNYNVNSQKIEVVSSASGLKFKFKKFKKKNKYNIGYFGSLDETKGSSFVLKLSEIDKKNNYFIYGGNDKEVLRLKKINQSKNLIIKKSVSYTEVKKYIHKMDILLIPSNPKKIKSLGGIGNIVKYTSPLKLFDYLASGGLIISTNIKVFNEILEDKKNCILMKNLDPNAWKKKISNLTKNQSYINYLKRNAYDLSKKFTYKERARQILRCLG